MQGYDLSRAIIDDEVLDTLTFQYPDVVLVKKIYPEKSKKASKKHKRRTRRGKAKQEKPVVLEDERDSDLIEAHSPSSLPAVESSADSKAADRPAPSKKTVQSSVFGWTGGDDEEYQAFHRRLVLEEQDEEEQAGESREIEEEEGVDPKDADLATQDYEFVEGEGPSLA